MFSSDLITIKNFFIIGVFALIWMIIVGPFLQKHLGFGAPADTDDQHSTRN